LNNSNEKTWVIMVIVAMAGTAVFTDAPEAAMLRLPLDTGFNLEEAHNG
jgi:hypothetical protein